MTDSPIDSGRGATRVLGLPSEPLWLPHMQPEGQAPHTAGEDVESGLADPRAAESPSGTVKPESRADSPGTPMAARVEECSSPTEGAPELGISRTWDPDAASEVGSGLPPPADVTQSDAEGEEDPSEAGQTPLQGALDQLQRLSSTLHDSSPPSSDGEEGRGVGEMGPLLGPAAQTERAPCLLHIATGRGLRAASRQGGHHLLRAEAGHEDLLSLLRHKGGLPAEPDNPTPLARLDTVAATSCPPAQPQAILQDLGAATGRLDAVESKRSSRRFRGGGAGQEDADSLDSSLDIHSWEMPSEAAWAAGALDLSSCGEGAPPQPEAGNKTGSSSLPAYKEVPGPCEPEDLLDGVIFGAKYLGSTQLVSEQNPPTSTRMAQAQEAVDRVKAPEGESQPMTEVDLFISTQRIKVLTANSQEAMMNHPLQTISYIADIGNILVLMARRRLPRQGAASPSHKQLYKMICHVFHSADAQLIAQAIGQAFSVAYQHFLRTSGIDPSRLEPRQCSADEDGPAEGEELYNGDLAHFSKQENCKEVVIQKQKGEILGVVIVESGWGSILPTVVIANLMHKGAAERSGKLSIGDRLMSVNGTSLVGLPLAACQGIIRDLKNQTDVTLCVVHCPPVTTAIVRRPDTKYPLGFCVENGIICSLMRGGIAERGGIRVGHRIIEINGQSVVAMPHEKIIQILTQAVSEVRIKTMPASTYRLLTGQEQPVFL